MYIAEDVTVDGRTLPACIIRALASDSFCAPDCWGSQLMFQMWHPVPLNRRAVGRFGLSTGYWTAHLTTSIHSRCYALGCTCRVFGCIGNLLYPLHVLLPHSSNYPKFLLSTNCMIKCACPLILDPKMFMQSLPIYTDLQKDLEYRRAIGRQKFRELRHAEVKRWCLGDAWGRLDIDGYGGYGWISDNARPKAHAQLQYVAIQEFHGWFDVHENRLNR